MRDRTLLVLVWLAILLSLAHDLDHVIRGDVRWPLTRAALPFFSVVAAIYALIGFGLYLYRKGTVGPRYWAIFAGVGVGFGWLAHFSPFSRQTPRTILAAYDSGPAGWLAVACLIALMLVLLAAAVYATRLWLRARAGRADLHPAA